MRKIALIVCLAVCTGCVSVQIPQYLQDKHPYKREYFASYDKTLEAVKKVLKNNEWKIASTADPVVFEAAQNKSSEDQRILLFTESRQTSMFLFSRYSQLNIYVRALMNATEVEIRYAAVVPVPFKQFRTYRNDSFVHKLLDQIADWLNKSHEQIPPPKQVPSNP